MTHHLLTLAVGLIAFIGGMAVARLLARSRAAASVPPLQPAASAAPTPPRAGDVDAGGGAPVEMHLVLNVLNRIVMALNANEHAQDGVADLADYLRAVDEMRRRPSQEALTRQVNAYWQLSRWLHGQPTDAFRLDAQLPGMPAMTLARLCRELTETIRDLEPARQADLAARLAIDDAGPGGRQVVVHAVAANVAEAVQVRLQGSPRGWSRSGQQLSRRVDFPADG